jgi:hypothetical protein
LQVEIQRTKRIKRSETEIEGIKGSKTNEIKNADFIFDRQEVEIEGTIQNSKEKNGMVERNSSNDQGVEVASMNSNPNEPDVEDK